MDYIKILYNRIQQLEPENVNQIIDHLLLLHYDDRDMIRLASCSDNMIYFLINLTKSQLGLSMEPSFGASPYSDLSPPAVSVSPPTQIRRSPNDFEFVLTRMQSSNVGGQLELVNHHPIVKDFPSSFSYPKQRLPVRTNQRWPSSEFSIKVCHYFIRGNCKYGNNCRFIHPQMYNPNMNDENHVTSPGSLGKLESEIIELLKSQGRLSVSIASLPMLYSAMYGKPLQAEGYVTESQRQGKSGYSLTKLLRLSNKICVIERPHGQHSVILAEDREFLENSKERKEQGGLVPGSQQIYLTFPADSTFTVQDVVNYFSEFGPVQDVRIPKQHKRMFGFVTFEYATTVQQILSKGNPHFVCTSRVLVKPYKEKSRLVDRKFTDKAQHIIQNGSRYMDIDAEMQNPIPPRAYRSAELWRKQYPLEQEQLTSSFVPPYAIIKRSTDDDLKLAYGQVERSDYMLDALNSESAADNRISNIRTNYKDIDSQDSNLPESLFSGTGISTLA